MGKRSWTWVTVISLVLAVVAAAVVGDLGGDSGEDPPLWDEVPAPNTLALAEYEGWLYEFLERRDYASDGWGRDKGEGFTRVRDTGPYIDGVSYGTHEAVRVYYSPSVVDWLKQGRRGPLPNGAMIVKEMFEAPAARWADADDEKLEAAVHLWAVMVKDDRGARDGWFWAFYDSGGPDAPAQPVDLPGQPTFEAALYPASGFGQYCTRCHASAEAEMTFSSLRNLAGGEGEPIRFRVDESWRSGPDKPLAGLTADHDRSDEPTDPDQLSPEEISRIEANLAAFETAFPQQTAVSRDAVVEIPNTSWDWVIPDPDGPTQFSTSVQCMSCHDGQGLPFGPNMFLPPRTSEVRSESDFDAKVAELDLTTEEQAALGEVHAVATAWIAEVDDAVAAGGLAPTQAAELRSLALESIEGLAARTGLSSKEVQAILGHFPGFNVSPFGEWRWSMMGLAGRDPIFHAQLESEVALWEPLQAPIENLCTSCHGAMGQRQLEIDSGKTQHLSGSPSLLDMNEPLFRQDFVLRTGEDEDASLGALAREGISCMVCHQVDETPAGDLPDGLTSLFSGNFRVAAPVEDAKGTWINQIHGQFEDIVERAMVDALGMLPKHSAYISSARMCGSCHTVVLPVLDVDGNVLPAPDGQPRLVFEQTTYLEWANSQYRDEFGGIDPATARPCQACHMPGTFHDPATGSETDMQWRIANIQDETYPEADEEAPVDEITVALREDGYARHTLAGINLFGLEMFKQFPEILGVSFGDYMTGSSDGLTNAIAEGPRLASEDSGQVQIITLDRLSDGVRAEVRVTNLAGHRFPSGVGFRRLFVEFSVVDASGAVRWSSGSTNEFGVIVDGAGVPLPSEFFEEDASGQQQYQPHHQTITSQGEVQIFEELALSPEGEFTTNFLNRDTEVKDNRLLPMGWSPHLWPGVTDEFTEEFLETTLPKGGAADDPNFGAGSDTVEYRVSGLPADALDGATVTARLFYQAIPPSYLADRFEQAKKANGQRLYFIVSNLDTSGTDIEDWKLEIASEMRPLPAG